MLWTILMIKIGEGKRLQSFLRFQWRKMGETFSWQFILN